MDFIKQIRELKLSFNKNPIMTPRFFGIVMDAIGEGFKKIENAFKRDMDTVNERIDGVIENMPDGEPTTIDNITDIPNRSYEDLQDKPVLEFDESTNILKNGEGNEVVIDKYTRAEVDQMIDNGEDKTFEYDQAIPSDEWIIIHPLNKYPSVSVKDSAGNLVEGAVEYVDKGKVIVRFNGAFSGTTILN